MIEVRAATVLSISIGDGITELRCQMEGHGAPYYFTAQSTDEAIRVWFRSLSAGAVIPLRGSPWPKLNREARRYELCLDVAGEIEGS